jgi:hypothetical protein
VLVDGFNVAARLRENNPEVFNYLANTPITFHYWYPMPSYACSSPSTWH